MTGTGSFGTASTPLSKLFTERVALDVRTSDPSSPEKGAIWFREDLDSGTDKFGELRWYDGSSTNGIPVFDKGTSGSSVEEVLGFKTADGIGYVPTASRSDAAYQQLSFQHSGSTLGLHDGKIASTIVDDFEDGNISEYGGDTGKYSVVSSPTASGSRSLEFNANGFASIASTSGLNTYPSQGDTFRCRVRIDENDDSSQVYWAAQSAVSDPDGYKWSIQISNSSFSFIKRESGSNTTLTSTTVTPPTGEFLDVEVDWGSSGGHTLTLFDSAGSQLAQISATDTTYTSGGIAFLVAPSGATSGVYFDHYRTV